MPTLLKNEFALRHLGPRPDECTAMLHLVGAASLDALIDEVVPPDIRRADPLDLPPAESEFAFLNRLRAVAARNHVFRSYIGLGYYDTITPSVIQRMVLENPGWYTPYTPYQAEIAQGRLEALLTFQTMVSNLTSMDVANASLLDEASAAAEAMTLLRRVQPRERGDANVFLVAETCFPQTIALLRARGEPLGIDVRVVPLSAIAFDARVFGALLQYPDSNGLVQDLRPIVARAHAAGVLVAVATDLLALTMLTPPGEMGADVVVGSAQRFGLPLGYGGPHAAFFATRGAYLRQTPGRIIGLSVDAHGQPAHRMALQTREQHIRRDKATSNICTAQALLASIAAFYAVYHGPEGLREIASRVHGLAGMLEEGLVALGCVQRNRHFFDTLRIAGAREGALPFDRVREAARGARVNLRYFEDGDVGISLDETTSAADVADLVGLFARALGQSLPDAGYTNHETRNGRTRPKSDRHGTDRREPARRFPASLSRSSAYLTHPVFNTHRSETEMMRYIRRLERKDIGLDTSMIPLGSCTMKLNAASEMLPITWPEFARMHPFVPLEQAQGYAQVVDELEGTIREMTDLPGVSLQPNSGAQGELAGLLVIRAWHRDRGESQRDVVLIPSSAHGTNPASAVMAGMRVVVVACDARGNVDVDDLREKSAQHTRALAALMVTYPSTHGVFEARIRAMCAIVHEHGGQVYMDGANMNAQVGLTSPGLIGADVCHLNLHKTFAIPHGGGGPGMGPIAVAAHLAPYLPGHPLVATGGPRAVHPVAAAPWGSALVLLIPYAYMRMLGPDGMTEASRISILSANYIKARLERAYPILYTGAGGRVAHEMILDLRPLKQASGIDEQDVAKRLMDFGFHAPTVSFPVPGTLMIEPTESEPKAELDRFCEALLQIREEIQAVIDGRADRQDNVLKHAPHTAAAVAADDWSRPYSRTQAAFPLPWVKAQKVWPPVGRIDNPYGDRHVICVCPPVETYAEEPVAE
ncbi:MAG: aminomethyl-transferring glycine dehydrogenase [Luteitalea sp.]|nr:aminomethyl-transferring glycine dehydrogenase [Luteitalea sp.]